MSNTPLEFTLSDLAQRIGAELIGDPAYKITTLATLQSAESGELSFIANPAYKKYLTDSHAGAVIMAADLVDDFAGNKLVVANPYAAYAKLTALFDSHNDLVPGIHPTAVIGEGCRLGSNVCIQANVVLADGVTLGDAVVVGAGSFIGRDSSVGDRTRISANVSIYHGVSIGSDCIFHSGSVIGADGFGFAPSSTGWVKVHQLGGVIIGNRVEVGANACIDRGALDNTIVGDGVILDNMVQIAHNVRLGKNTAIAGLTAVAGSVTIGDNCTVGGCSAIAGHITLTDNVHLSGMSMVINAIKEPGSYSSGIPSSPTKEWRKNAARFRQLDALASRLIRLERGQKDI